MTQPLVHSAAASAAAKSPSPSVRIYDDDSPDRGDGLSPQMTLSAFYRFDGLPHERWSFRHHLLEALGKAKRNIDQYDQSIGYWSRWAWGTVGDDGRPVPAARERGLVEIDDLVTANFVFLLAHLPGRKPGEKLGPNTIRKHCTHIQAVLDRTGPRSPFNKRFRKAQSLLAEVPLLEKPAEFERDPIGNFSMGEIAALIAACPIAAVPSYVPPELRPRWWRNLYLFDYNTGLRVGSLVAAKRSKLSRDADGLWLRVAVKGGREKRVFLNEFAERALLDMQPLTGFHDPNFRPLKEGQPAWGYHDQIFHWPHELNWLHDNHKLIVLAAGLPPDRQLGFHGFRKAMVTNCSRTDPLAAGMQAGHSLEVMQKNYVNPSRMADGMKKLEQPRDPGHDRQRRLF